MFASQSVHTGVIRGWFTSVPPCYNSGHFDHLVLREEVCINGEAYLRK